jgi:8-oxo-dGTP diphosphatase
MGNKIILLNSSGAFLINGDSYLLMKRSPTREIAPNLWSCVGGHMEENEINNPFETCVREIWEESGISKEHIYNLKLRYIIIRQYKNIIRQNYIYFGETDVKEIVNTEEGTLHWIKEENLLEKEYTKTYTEMVKHYIQNKSIYKDKIIVGIAGNESGGLKMSWSILEDFE